MYPYLREKVIIVEGKTSDGIYDLNSGVFHRINKKASELLKKLDGTIEIGKFTYEEQGFIKNAINKKIVKNQKTRCRHSMTTLEEGIRHSRPLRFAWLEITSKCNQNCLHCFMGKDLNAFEPYRLDDICIFIKTMHTLGISQLILTGGEPTLHPEFKEILEYAALFDINLTLLTNGTTPYIHDFIPLFRKYGVRSKLSILGWKDSHDIMVGMPGAFDKLMRTIDIYIEEKAPIELGMTICSINYQDVATVREYANQKRIRLEMSPIYPLGKAKDNQEILFKHPLRNFIKVCQKDKLRTIENTLKFEHSNRITKPINKTDYEAVDLTGYLTDSFECGQKIIAILSNGKITPCLLLRESEFWIGDVKEEEIAAILDYDNPKREKYNKQMKLSNINECSGCEALYVCKGGGCPAITYAITEKINDKNPYYSKCYYKN